MLIIFLWNCSRKEEQLELGFEYIKKGNFDAALERFQKVYREYPDDLRVLKGLGYILSLRKISMVSSIHLLEEYMKKRDDPEVRRELLKLYLDMGMFSKAERLIASDRISVEEYLSLEMAIYRAAISCLKEPNQAHSNELKKIPQSTLRDYYLARCMMQDSYKLGKSLEFKEIIDRFEDSELRCELEFITPGDKVMDDIRHGVILRECRKKYPGSLTIQRERPVKIYDADVPRLFDDFLLTPNDPDHRVMEEYKILIEERSKSVVN